MKNRIRALLIILIASIGVLLPIGSKADGNSSAFSVSPLFGDLPIQSHKQYFALNAKPNHQYELPLLLKNNEDKPIRIKLTLNNAETLSDGTISYANPKALQHDSNSVANQVRGSRFKTVTVQPHQVIKTKYMLKTNSSIDGTELGGITATGKAPHQKKQKFVNMVSYVVGVSLNNTSQNDSKTNLKQLSIKNVKVVSRDNTGFYRVTLANPTPQLVSHFRMRTRIFNGKKVIDKQTMPDVSIAPKSNLIVLIPKKARQIRDGRIIIDLTGNGEHFQYKKMFSIYQKSIYKQSYAGVIIAELVAIELLVLFWICRLIYHNHLKG